MQKRRERGGGGVVWWGAGVLPGAGCTRSRPARAVRRPGRRASARAQTPASRPRRALAVRAPVEASQPRRALAASVPVEGPQKRAKILVQGIKDRMYKSRANETNLKGTHSPPH